MVHRVEKYADGGKVVSPKPAPKPRPKAPGTRDTIPSPKPTGPVDTLRNQRRRQEQLLGLKDGGKVRRKRKR